MRVICNGHIDCKDNDICEHSKPHYVIDNKNNAQADNCFLNKLYQDDGCTCENITKYRKLKLEKLNENIL